MASVVERFAVMERCRGCFAVMPLPPAPRVCEKCQRVTVTPRWSEWPHALRTFLLIRYAERHHFPSWRSMQDSWELLLIGNYERTLNNGRIIPQGAPADDLFLMAVKDAEEWRLAGAKTACL